MAENEELFKTTAFGGYDKEEVQQELQKLKENAYAEKTQILMELESSRKETVTLRKALEEKDARITELQDTLLEKDRELSDLERTIREKYQSYVDNYDTIGSLIYEAKIHAKQVNRETEEERQKMLEEARSEAARIREEASGSAAKSIQDAQIEIDRRNRAGQVQYEAVQEEINNVMEIFNNLQKQFMSSYKTIQEIVRDRPDADEDLYARIREETKD